MSELITALQQRPRDAVVIESPDSSMTAGEVLSAVSALQEELVAAGIDRLGLLASNSPEWVITDLACQAGNICLLPLPVFFSDAQIRHSMCSVGVDAVLTDDPQRVISVMGEACVRAYGAASVPRSAGGLTLLIVRHENQPELPAGTQKITFTSGSTGAPRGVCLSDHQQLNVSHALATALQIKSPRHVCLLPLSTLLENVGGVYYPLLTGGTVVLPAEADTGFTGSSGLDIRSLLNALDRLRPTSIILIPQMLVGLVAALQAGWQPPKQLRFAAVGGAKVSPGLLAEARLQGLPVYEGYGLSETGSVACLNYPDRDLIGSVGAPLAHVDVNIIDAEVVISGNCFLGYVGQPESWGATSVATGDLGTLDAEGYLHLQGRRNNLLISSFGRNISPEWVESELLQQPHIYQCVVLGDARPYCTALLVPASPNVSDARLQQCVDHVNEALPDYARICDWRRLTQPLTPADGLYTENGRPRRAQIATRYSALIDSLYATASEPQRITSP